MKTEYTVEVNMWRDKVNGNTYHACRCHRHEDGAVLCCPLQYGYGHQYEATALAAMLAAGWLPSKYTEQNVYTYERDNDYPILWVVNDTLKREAVALGAGK